MKKAKQDFCFPFYFQRYLSGTMGFTTEMHGAYLLAMIYQFQNGHFSEASINRVIDGKFDIIKHKYEIDENGLYFNETMEEVIIDRKNFIETKRNNRLGKTKDKPQLNGSSTVDPLQGSGSGDGSKGVVIKERFDTFWKAYPRKKSKADALKAWKQVKPSQELLDTILSKLVLLQKCDDWTKDDGQFIPYPASWLRAGGWDDEVEEKKEIDYSRF
jgi:hypothetical protein